VDWYIYNLNGIEMELNEILNEEIIEVVSRCANDLEIIEKLKRQAAYNILTLLSSNVHKEDFHSDVIASLLDFNGLHNERDKFLNLFIDFLNKNNGFNIQKEAYLGARVIREIGNVESRLDIVIIGSNRCIIIENKMNNAPNMIEQLDRYYYFAVENGWKVDAIVYLTLDGLKLAPRPRIKDAELVLLNIAAFTNKSNDLISGWLDPCLEQCSENNLDCQSLIHQYQKLIKHLNIICMKNHTLDNFYSILNDEKNIETINTLIELQKQIPVFRIKKIASRVENYSPFKDSSIYLQNATWIYNKFEEEDNAFKVDYSVRDDGSISLLFWNPPFDRLVKGQTALKEKLESIKMIDEFEEESGFHGYLKIFSLSVWHDFHSLDNEVVRFLNEFLEKLRLSKN